MEGSSNRRLAAKEEAAAWVRRADQRDTSADAVAARSDWGLDSALAWASMRIKLDASLLYNKLRVVMDEQQPNDWTRFRPNIGIDDSFVFLKCVSSKSLEWNAPIWFAGSDLTKAFDRIEYNPLFDVLLQQGVPRRYSTLL